MSHSSAAYRAGSPFRARPFQRINNLNNQNALYKHGMTPVFRLSGNPNWARLKQKVMLEVRASFSR